MEERRLLLAVALSLLVLTAYQLLFPTPPPRARRPSPAPGAGVSPAASVASPGAAASSGASGGPASPAASPAPVGAVVRIADDAERRVEVQGGDIAVAFSNRGARLVSWQLKRYPDAKGKPEEMVQIVQGAPRALDVETGDATIDGRLRDALFRPSAELLTLKGGGESELRFQWAEGDVEAEKVLRFQAQGYLVGVRASVRRSGQELSKRVLWGPGLGNPTAAEMEVQGYHAPQGVFDGPGGVERIAPEKIGPSHFVSDVRWAGVESTHFAALWIPPTVPGAAELRTLDLPPEEGRKRQAAAAAVVLGSGESALLFVGPKDHSLLTRLDHDLVAVVPVGSWIGPIVVPLMGLLRWVHGWVGNYGWSIVVLTILINLIMAPLRHYSIANGIKMAALAPEMRVIQERYRKLKLTALDPRRQEMQEEIGALYQRHGMNMNTQMLVGCLPILITLPFLAAFYRVLQVAIELRGASFLWIPDLSQRDPLFLTPVLMGISMFLMQRMMPSAMDAAQQRMMMMVMPVILVVMFHAAPAGLNLYWLSSNLCSIVQQAVTLRIIRGHDARVPRKERRRA